MSLPAVSVRVLELYRQGLRFFQFHYTRWHQTRLEAALPPAAPPMPPPLLRYRVQGNFDRTQFDAIGRESVRNIENALTRTGARLSDFSSVLDFACGCGRSMRHLARTKPETWTLHGSDVDAEAIAWNRQHLGEMATWTVNPPNPPTDYADGQFDLIICISLFTHLSAEHQFAWLTEVQRILKSGGVALLTVRGSFHSDRLPEPDRRVLQREGILYKERPRRWVRLDGHPDFYQTTYHTPEYVRNRWGAYLDLVEYIPRGLGDSQDLVIMRRACR